MRISDWSSDVCSSDLCLMMHHLPQPALVEEQIGCDQVGAADLLETDNRGETAVEEGARSVAKDLRRSRAAENGAPASHHLVAAVERIPAGMAATDRRPAYHRLVQIGRAHV